MSTPHGDFQEWRSKLVLPGMTGTEDAALPALNHSSVGYEQLRATVRCEPQSAFVFGKALMNTGGELCEKT